eukprot:COSAG01_NODE_7553_length_3153_cov_9.276686_4_plen_75_part_00
MSLQGGCALIEATWEVGSLIAPAVLLCTAAAAAAAHIIGSQWVQTPRHGDPIAPPPATAAARACPLPSMQPLSP